MRLELYWLDLSSLSLVVISSMFFNSANFLLHALQSVFHLEMGWAILDPAFPFMSSASGEKSRNFLNAAFLFLLVKLKSPLPGSSSVSLLCSYLMAANEQRCTTRWEMWKAHNLTWTAAEHSSLFGETDTTWNWHWVNLMRPKPACWDPLDPHIIGSAKPVLIHTLPGEYSENLKFLHDYQQRTTPPTPTPNTYTQSKKILY